MSSIFPESLLECPAKAYASIAQWIEQRPSKAKMKVRFLLGAPYRLLLSKIFKAAQLHFFMSQNK